MAEAQEFAPETLDEASALLLAANSRARPLFRGTQIVAEAEEAGQAPSLVLDLRRIPECNRLDYDERNGLRIGAAVSGAVILSFPPVQQLYPMLADGLGLLDPAQDRERATLGEHLRGAEPSSGLAPPLICLRASAAIYGPHGWSEQGLEVFFLGAGRTALQSGEFVVDVRFPAPPPRSNGVFLRVPPGGETNVPVIGVGAFLAMEKDLVTCCGARLAISGMAPASLRTPAAERFLSGRRLDEEAVGQAVDLAARDIWSGADPGMTSGDRPSQIKALIHRAVRGALGRVRAAAT